MSIIAIVSNTNGHVENLDDRFKLSVVAAGSQFLLNGGEAASGCVFIGSNSTSVAEAGGFDFSHALALLKTGKRVARAGWHDENTFVYLVPAASYPAQTGAAKAHFGEGAMAPYRAYLALKGDDDMVSTWTPSTVDLLANDYILID